MMQLPMGITQQAAGAVTPAYDPGMMTYAGAGNYEKHFEEVLEKFAEEYKEWEREGFSIPWQREYRNQYQNFIT